MLVGPFAIHLAVQLANRKFEALKEERKLKALTKKALIEEVSALNIQNLIEIHK